MPVPLLTLGGQVEVARALLDPANVALDRAERVLKRWAGGQRQVDEAGRRSTWRARYSPPRPPAGGMLAKVVGDGDAA